MTSALVDDTGSARADLWLHLANLKKLAKLVKAVAVVLHSRALDGLCSIADRRANGWLHFNSHRPVEPWRFPHDYAL